MEIGAWFKRYYWRVVGVWLAGGGLGFMVDEFVHGPFTLTPTNHEFWGLVALVIGCICISRKPHGK